MKGFRMAAKPQQGIRAVIHTLLSVLEDSDVPRIPSESFRKAKFNQPEAIQPFWDTLFHVVQLTKSLDCSQCSRLPHRVANTSAHLARHVTLSVRKHLFHLGYNRTAFYHDPVSSRELVLVFAWLLQKTAVVRKLTQHHLSAANYVCIPLKPGHKFLVDTVEQDVARFTEEVELIRRDVTDCSGDGHKGVEHISSALKRMLWLKGKLDCRFKSAQSAQQGYQKLADKIHRYAGPFSRSESLTVHEVYLLKHPEQLTSYLQLLETHLAALQRLHTWQSCEGVFWQWMESVLDLQEREEALADSQSVEEDSEASPPEKLVREELELKVRSLEREVNSMLERNRPHIDKINRTWLMKSRAVRKEDIHCELSLIEDNLKLDDDSHTDCTDDEVIVEQLTCMDLPLCLLRESGGKQSSRKQWSHVLEEEGHSDKLRSLTLRLEQVQRALEANKDKMRIAQDAFARQIERIEQVVPPNVCKLET